uniref:Uncharacterized protein n=1 Tax=viral metagenome TaxID=1070528 RepID=A0A6H1ZTY1_9ZZZZ
MVEPKEELPFVEEPAAVVAAVAPPKPEVNVDELVAELERAGVTNAQELQNKFKASSESGRLAQLLGEERKHARELQAKLEQLANRPAQVPDDIYSERPIDIESVVERSLEKALTTREIKAQKMQEANIASWNQIQTDEDYGLVREIWEAKLKDPNFVFRIQSGMVDPVREYTQTVRGYYKNMMKKSVDTIRQLKGGVPAASPPHIESGERIPSNIVSEDPTSGKRKKFDEFKKKATEKGVLTPEEELDLLDALL